jgi:hypothetical protein
MTSNHSRSGDINYGAGRGVEIERNFFATADGPKRFFDRRAIEALFDSWDVLFRSEYWSGRYRSPKLLWEVAARRR